MLNVCAFYTKKPTKTLKIRFHSLEWKTKKLSKYKLDGLLRDTEVLYKNNYTP